MYVILVGGTPRRISTCRTLGEITAIALALASIRLASAPMDKLIKETTAGAVTIPL
jgi:hypothetical protein